MLGDLGQRGEKSFEASGKKLPRKKNKRVVKIKPLNFKNLDFASLPNWHLCGEY